MKKNILMIIIIISVIAIFTAFITHKIKSNGRDVISVPIDYEESKNDEPIENEEKIKEIIENQGFSTQTDIYEMKTEYDGREQIAVKDSIEYKVALSGVIKKDKPEFDEIDTLLEKAPTHTGVWIEEDSRDKFMEILKSITKASYTIDEDGFLEQNESFIMNTYDKKIKEMLFGKRLFVFAINSECYIIDEVTGEIVVYPFEEIEPEQGYELFESDNRYMFIVSKNNSGKIDQEEIIRFILKDN